MKILTLVIIISLSCSSKNSSENESDDPAVFHVAMKSSCSGVYWEGQCVDTAGRADFSEALQARINRFPAWNGADSVPRRIDLPLNSTLLIEQTVVIDRPIAIYGNGSIIKVADGITGFSLSSPEPNGGGSDFSSLNDLWIRGTGKANRATAIDIRRHGMRIRNIACNKMQNCFNVRGQYNEEGGNANAQRFSNILIRECGTGIHISGGDSQVGLFSGIEVLGCDKGIVDNSAFGNTWVGVSAEGMHGAGFSSNQASSYLTVVGGNLESGETLAHVKGRSSLVMGGNLPAKLDSDSGADRIGYQSAKIAFRTDGPRVVIPGLENGDVISWNWQDGLTSNGFEVKESQQYRITWDEKENGWSLWWGGPRTGITQAHYLGTRVLTLFGRISKMPKGSATLHNIN